MRTVQKGHGMDDTGKLFGLMHGNLPSVNSLIVKFSFFNNLIALLKQNNRVAFMP
jgi:hypothetical protein